jgi:autotransporter-associated beta strand protein
MVAHWLRSWIAPRPTTRKPQRIRLEMDALEDRFAPATLTWTGAANNLWSNANNWLNESSNPQAPVAGDDLIFPTGPATLTTFNDLAAGTAFQSITFTGAGAAYNLGGNAIVIGDNGGGGIFHNATSAIVTINFTSVTLASGAAKTFDVLHAASRLNFTTTINFNGAGARFGQAGSAGIISAALPITGAGDLTKDGTGILILSGANTFTGNISLNGGTIQLGASQVLPDGNAFVMAAGTTLDLNNFSESLGSLAGPAGATITLGSGTLTVGGLNTDTTFAGTITGAGSLVKTGTGRLVLAGSGTYAGATTINQGTLEINGTNASPVLVNTGGTLAGTGGVANTTVGSGGRIAPGTAASPGTLVAQITAFQTGSTFFVRLNGLNPGESDRLTSGSSSLSLGGATLTGTLGYAAAIGDSFTILTGNGITGTFASGAAAFLGGRKFSVAYNPNSVVITRVIANSVTTLTSSLNPSQVGQQVTFTATVTGETGTTGAPTGTVQFFDGATLLGTSTLDANGQATFSTSALPAGARTITAVYSGDADYNGSTSPVLTQNVGSAQIGSIVVFAGSPQSTVVDTAFATNLQARVLDTNGNPVAGVSVTFTAPQTTTLATGTFTGQVPTATAITDANGVATAPVLTANTIAGTFTVTATIGAFTANFNLTNLAGVATKLTLLQQPTTTTAGQPITPEVRVGIVDQFNNLTNSTAAVTMALGNNPTGTTLNGTLTVNAVGGVAIFSNLSINKAGTGYTLVATSTGLTSVTSNAFNIVGGTAVRFVVTAPTRVTNGVSFQVTITAQDQFGNTATGYTGTISFSSPSLGLTLPGNQTFTAADAGVKRVSITSRRVGQALVIVRDTATSSTIPPVSFRFWNLFGNRLIV